MAKGWWRRFVIATQSTGFSLRSFIFLSSASCRSCWTTSWTHLADFFVTRSYCWRNASVTLYFGTWAFVGSLNGQGTVERAEPPQTLGWPAHRSKAINISAVFHLLVARHKPLEPLPLGDYYLVVKFSTKKVEEHEPPCATKLYHCFLQRRFRLVDDTRPTIKERWSLLSIIMVLVWLNGGIFLGVLPESGDILVSYQYPGFTVF